MDVKDITLQQVLDDFALFETWEDKYRYLIDMGNGLAPLSRGEQVAANKVSGCVSQVWLVSGSGDGGRLIFRGTSDAHIVRGLIALLLKIYSDKLPQEVLEADSQGIFERLGFADHLTPQRSSGFYAMVQRIKKDAQTALTV